MSITLHEGFYQRMAVYRSLTNEMAKPGKDGENNIARLQKQRAFMKLNDVFRGLDVSLVEMEVNSLAKSMRLGDSFASLYSPPISR